MMYNKLVREYFFHPQHVGTLDLTEPFVAYFRNSGANHTNVIDLYLQCDKLGYISKICFKSNGNPYMIAALEWWCRQIENKNINKLPSITYKQLIDVLEISTAQYPIALQVEDVVQEVLVLIKKKLEGYLL